MKPRILAVLSGSVLVFLLIMGAARGAMFDAHERAAGKALPPAVSAVDADAHGRGVAAGIHTASRATAGARQSGRQAAAVRAASTPTDAHDRSSPLSPRRPGPGR
jgi:hypothetical protein